MFNPFSIFKKRRVKTPSFFQMEMVECGAVALGIILGYYRRFITLEQLRIDCGVSRDGCKALNIIRAARKHGLEAEGYRANIEEIRELELPFIAFWHFNHFIVVEGFKGNYIYINDPAVGHRILHQDEFAREYSGIALNFIPTDDFKKEGKPPVIARQLLKRLSGQQLPLLYLFLIGLSITLLNLGIPIFGKIFVDDYIINHNQSIIKVLIIGISVITLLTFLLTYLQNHYLMKFQNKLTILFSEKFLWHTMRLPLRFFSQRYSGDITYRMESIRGASIFISNIFIVAVLDSILVLIYLVLMFYFDVTIALVILGIAIVNLAIFQRISKVKKEKSLLLSVDIGNYYSQCYSNFRIMESIKASGAEQESFGKLVGSQVKVSNSIHTLAQKTIFINMFPTALDYLSSIVVLIIGAFKIMNGEMSIGTLVALQNISVSFMSPITNLINIAGQIQTMTGLIAKLDDVLHHQVEPQLNLEHFSKTETLLEESRPKLSGHIEIQDLSYGFNILESPILSNISFSIFPGEHIAIVGSSGSGKSTLAKLIANLYQPWSGKVLMDGRDINEINKMILANSIAMVEQDGILFNASIKDNITMWDSTARFKKIIQSAKDACIHEQISLKPHGYDTIIGDNGENFSGGERQRIDIARALNVNPNILILDEATSELDPIIESEIYDNIRRQGCTTIIVAHRLNTVSNADKIIVLEKGKIVQIGSHEELIGTDGVYKKLMSML